MKPCAFLELAVLSDLSAGRDARENGKLEEQQPCSKIIRRLHICMGFTLSVGQARVGIASYEDEERVEQSYHSSTSEKGPCHSCHCADAPKPCQKT